MPISVNGREGSFTAILSGEIDHHGARTMMDQLDDVIAAHLPRKLTLDFSGITFMDSSGIALLLRVQKRMSALGGSLRVTAIPTQPRRVLDAAGLGRLITFE